MTRQAKSMIVVVPPKAEAIVPVSNVSSTGAFWPVDSKWV